MLDKDESPFLIIEDKEQKEISMSFEFVTSVGDAVLLSGALKESTPRDQREKSPERDEQKTAEQPRECPSCGHTNKPATKFCVECGSKLTR
jgi:uncharacterized paraquat-inducible protein A